MLIRRRPPARRVDVEFPSGKVVVPASGGCLNGGDGCKFRKLYAVLVDRIERRPKFRKRRFVGIGPARRERPARNDKERVDFH